MKTTRLATLPLLAALALSLASVATASAEIDPLFLPANNQTFTATSGVSHLINNEASVICQKDTASGNIASALLAGNVFFHYLECTVVSANEPKTTCTVNSVGAPEGLIITDELHGILGLVLPTEDVGILFLPVSGKVITTIAEAKNGATKCTPLTKATGSFAGLITPVGVVQLTGKIVFPEASIKRIDLTHGIGFRLPELVLYNSTSTILQTENITYGERTGVT